MKKALCVKKLYDGTLNKPKENVIVCFDEAGIFEIAAGKDAKMLSEKFGLLVENTNAYMVPGLIDAHVHLMLPGDGTAGEDYMVGTPMEQIQLLALHNAMTALNCGVTTVRDVGSYFGLARHVRDYCKKAGIGPDILVCGMPLTTTNGHCNYMGGAVDSDFEIRKMIRTQMKQGIDCVKLMATAGGTKGISQADPFSLQELQVAVEESHRNGLKITMHASRMPGLKKAVTSGTDGIEHCQFVEQGRTVRDKQLANEICEKGIYPCHTLAVNVSGLNSYFKDKPKEKWTRQDKSDYEWQVHCLDLMPEQLNFQLSQGVPTIGGSDAGWKFTLFKNAMQLSMEMMQRAGMQGIQIIHSCTGLCAKALGIDHERGTITVGKKADMLLLKADPANDIKAFYSIASIYKNGIQVK